METCPKDPFKMMESQIISGERKVMGSHGEWGMEFG